MATKNQQYKFYLGKLLLPIAPPTLEVTINNRNETMDLINGEINIIKDAGLTDFTFEARLPCQQYPFAQYKDGFKKADYFLTEIELLKKSKKPFNFIVIRKLGKKNLFKTNIKVTLEDYTITEDAEEGFDSLVEINLKSYREYGLKKITIEKPSAPSQPPTATESINRPAENPPQPSSGREYTVKSGDCLWNISKYFYGDGSKWPTIHNANSWIKNPNLIYPGQVLIIP